jgi:hypothetical protein
MDGNTPSIPVSPQKSAIGVPPTPQIPSQIPSQITSQIASQVPNKIQHSKPGLVHGGSGTLPTAPPHSGTSIPVPHSNPDKGSLPVAESVGLLGNRGKITAFGKDRRHEDTWSRTPNTTGSGAIHVKTFHCKLTEDALSYMDQSINEWLDAHPQYEVKFVSSTIGTLTGKLKEPALFCQVWV